MLVSNYSFRFFFSEKTSQFIIVLTYACTGGCGCRLCCPQRYWQRPPQIRWWWTSQSQALVETLVLWQTCCGHPWREVPSVKQAKNVALTRSQRGKLVGIKMCETVIRNTTNRSFAMNLFTSGENYWPYTEYVLYSIKNNTLIEGLSIHLIKLTCFKFYFQFNIWSGKVLESPLPKQFNHACHQLPKG